MSTLEGDIYFAWEEQASEQLPPQALFLRRFSCRFPSDFNVFPLRNDYMPEAQVRWQESSTQLCSSD